MKNMGLFALRIVEPPEGLHEEQARSLAYRAWDVLDSATVCQSLAEAVADCTLVVATSSRAGEGEWTPRRLAEEGLSRSRGGKVALVFGPEATGLSREELDLCPVRVRIPASPEQPSLNLAQAVLLVSYEIFLASGQEALPLPSEGQAEVAEVEAALRELKDALLEIGFLNPDNPGSILAEIRRLLSRSGLTSREVSILRGMARQIRWAGGVARGTSRAQ